MFRIVFGAAVLASSVFCDDNARLGMKGGHYDDEGYGPDGFDMFGFNRQGLDAWGRAHENPLAGLIPPATAEAVATSMAEVAPPEAAADGAVNAVGMANTKAAPTRRTTTRSTRTTKAKKTKKPKKPKKPKKTKKSKTKKSKKAKKTKKPTQVFRVNKDDGAGVPVPTDMFPTETALYGADSEFRATPMYTDLY